jgi:hypothetical protein
VVTGKYHYFEFILIIKKSKMIKVYMTYNQQAGENQSKELEFD